MLVRVLPLRSHPHRRLRLPRDLSILKLPRRIVAEIPLGFVLESSPSLRECISDLTIFLSLSPPLCLGAIVEHDLVAVDVKFVVGARHIFVRLDAHLCALVGVVCSIISGCAS